ncbi:hypothetical protein CEXT_604441 [Caerostris extrusa]|uniref:Uncharacterized protein n=1 Tax=Caerostris extrusa TaxID=172846 RepID=A0AAV4RFU8_CAEEX|nr:hypothetical protein CEXT_604441 [Caerostris extrusa]
MVCLGNSSWQEYPKISPATSCGTVQMKKSINPWTTHDVDIVNSSLLKEEYPKCVPQHPVVPCRCTPVIWCVAFKPVADNNRSGSIPPSALGSHGDFERILFGSKDCDCLLSYPETMLA